MPVDCYCGVTALHALMHITLTGPVLRAHKLKPLKQVFQMVMMSAEGYG